MYEQFDDEFYPTPARLIHKMVSKIQNSPEKVLEPSAGKGDIVDYLKDDCSNRRMDISTIEKNDDLRAALRGKNIKVIDADFLSFSGPDKFDLIIANPPFSEGDKHLLKAIDIMYRGEIVFLLNAETIKNPYTNTRKDLVRKLEELNADIEYIQEGFSSAERKTSVEIALIYINIERNMEDDLFDGADDRSGEASQTVEDANEITTGKTIPDLVAEYNQVVALCTDTLVNYYRNYKKVGEFIAVNREPSSYAFAHGDLTELMQSELNKALKAVRIKFWRDTLNIDAVQKRLTQKRQDEFETVLATNCDMDFTENNIRTFILNLIGGYEQTLTDAVLEIFDKFTRKHSYSENAHEKNIHYFNGWKTNNAFKVGKKVIIPIYAGYGGDPFLGYSGEWELDYQAARVLHDIDLVMSYFDGMSDFFSIGDAVTAAYTRGQSRDINSTYFTITTFKKGTIHLTFKDEGILRRFNTVACKGKKWLPEDYGNKEYEILALEERQTADSFEGKESYAKHCKQPLFAVKNDQMLLT